MRTTFATISKYPPYVSGHAHQAYWLNRALSDVLQRPQHQVSYCGAVPAWYQDKRIVVHDVAASCRSNPKVPDGHLLKGLAARLAGLTRDRGVTAILALYADPHAEVANRAARTARMLGHRTTVAVSVEGSDLTSSLARHTTDGEAAVLLADIAAADVVMAVSQRARSLLLAAAAELPDHALAENLASRVIVRYPGLPPEFFHAPDADRVARWRHSWRIEADQNLVSMFVRLVPEKGVGRMLDIAELARDRGDLVFGVAGDGPLAHEIADQARRRGLSSLRLMGRLRPSDAHLLRAATAVAVLPSQRTKDWEETFGIAAIEYQALGVPVLASECAGFAESCAVTEFRIAQDAPASAWLERIDALLRDRQRLSATAAEFASAFTSRRSAELTVDAVELAALADLAVR